KIASFDGDPLVNRETLELVRAYYRISEPTVRKRVFELVQAVAKPASGDKGGTGN
ncbi:MAG: transcriptional regulator, partial [Alphaproteobacteria bacterium]